MISKKFSIIALSILSGFTAVVTATGVLTWFQSSVTINTSNNEIMGGSEGAYYESGEGTSASPYIISTPRHLYNLAWLQYLGFYNKDTEKGKQYYFKLKKDIDMSGWTIPPIGTEEKPFIGNFNGQGHVVSNATISNDYSEFNRHPSVATSDYFSAHYPNIVGFFGVIGDYGNQYTDGNGNVKDGMVYNSTNNVFTNTGILSSTIKSAASKTLVGLAAGYVNGNITNVAVNESNLYTKVGASTFSSFDSISDYSLVGHCEKKYLSSMNLRSEDADIPTLDNPNTASGGDNWGGSINMLDMYTYLRGLADS